MHAHIIESPRTQTRPVDDTAAGLDVAAVGTFACGQSDQGSFYVAADADVGSFASGIQAKAEATRSGARVLHPSA